MRAIVVTGTTCRRSGGPWRLTGAPTPSRSSRSSGRPPRASPTWPSTSPSGSGARSSTPTPCSSTAAWTSARPSCPLAERRGIAHHQLDVLDVTEEASVAGYQVAARADIAAIRGRGHRPLLVGGSGLYVRAALDRLEIPPTDAEVRARLEAEAEVVGGDALHARLRASGPAVRRLDPARQRAPCHPGPRGHRARPAGPSVRRCPNASSSLPQSFSACESTATSSSSGSTGGSSACGRTGLRHRDRDPARSRPASTASPPAGPSATARPSPSSTATLDETAARRDTAQATRRYARRQESWFRPDPRIVWLDAASPDLLDRALDGGSRGGCAGASRHVGEWLT